MREILEQGVASLPFEVTANQLRSLQAYGEMILKWNRVYNLTAIRTPNDVATHHLLDCLAVLPDVEACLAGLNSPALLDVGAGAGLPGIVWAIMKPEWQLNLVDTVQKKAAFMQQAAANLGLKSVTVYHSRVEQLEGLSFDLITSRAFSSLSLLIELTSKLLKPDGCYAALKGRQDVDQTVPQGWKLERIVGIEVPLLDEERNLFVIRR